MVTSLTKIQEASPPSITDVRHALESSRLLSRIIANRKKGTVQVHITGADRSDQSMSVPISAFRLLNDILSEMAQGNAVTLIPVNAELTTRQAADLLNVSRPFLISHLEKGMLPFRKVGTHRRVMFKDVLAYKQNMDQKRIKTLEELSAVDQELGLGY